MYRTKLKQVLAAVALAPLLLTGCEQGVTSYTTDQSPSQLSDWGLLSVDNLSLVIDEQTTPYSLNSPLFTDYAHKLRTIYVPPGMTATMAGDRISYPVGTIITKTFYYPKGAIDGEVVKTSENFLLEGKRLNLSQVQLIETRLLVKQADGWQAIPYVWNSEQTDATLEIAGDVKGLTLIDESERTDFAYVVPDANQCSGCHASDHTTAAIMPIGPKPSNLNGLFDYGKGQANQLQHWAVKGLLDGSATSQPSVTLASYSPNKRDQLDLRARSYLDANCAHCHNPNGAADTSGLMLNIEETNMRALGLCKPPVAAGRGAGSRPFSLYAGHPDKSIMLYRMQSTDPGEMMPEIGRSLSHDEGVALLGDWIQSLTQSCDKTEASIL